MHFLAEAKKREISDADLLYQFALAYHNGNGVPKDSQKELEILKDAAISGSSGAQFMLAKCYEDGVGIEKSDDFAKIWYNKAAEQGNVEAKERLKTLNSLGQKK